MSGRRALSTSLFRTAVLLSLVAVACSDDAAIPTAVITAPATAELGATVQLDASQSEPANRQLTYSWRFVNLPDVSAATLNDATIVNPSFVADTPGEYTVGLVVFDGFSFSPETSHVISVSACGSAPPVVDAIAADPAAPGVGSTVRFNATISDQDNAAGCGLGQSFLFNWRLVGLPTASRASLNDPTLPSPWLEADASGTYTVELLVSDSAGLVSDLASFSVTVSECGEGRPVITSLAADPAAAAVGQTVILTAAVEDPDNATGCDANQDVDYAWSLVSAPAASDADIQRAALEEAWLVPDVSGDYSVSLVVVDDTGRSSDPRVITVFASDDVTAATVTASPDTGLVPLTVDFTCSATGDAPIRYAWSFGNGSVSSLQNPSFTYTGAGVFTATCLAIDVDGDAATSAIDITVVADTTPTVEVSADPRAGVAPLEVDFTTVVNGGEGEIRYLWNFGDGKASTDSAPTTTYDGPGLYTAVVTVIDEDGDASSATIEIAVGSDDAPAVAVDAEPATGVSPLDVQLSAATAGGNAPLTFAWEFGDGEESTLQNPRHTYETGVDAFFTARVTVTDVDGDTASDEIGVFVEGDIGVTNANATATPTAGRVPLLVGLTCSADGGNEPLEYSWAFGDGETSNLQNPTHVYLDPDTYTATCTVTDADGDSASDTVAVTAQLDRVPSVALSADVTEGVAPLTVTFEATASGGDAPLALDWDFGDGGVLPNGAAVQTRPYGPGVYQIGVVVEDVDGDTDRATLLVTVQPDDEDLEVVASANPATGIGSLADPVEVSLTAAVAGGNPPYTYAWDFANGAPALDSTLAAPTAAFAPGTYAVTVVVTDRDGDTGSAGVQVVVATDLVPELGALGANDTNDLDLAPLLVNFTCPLTTPGNAPHTFAWSFGDGQSSTLQNPSHTYAAAGSYTAACTVTDADGDTDTASVNRTAFQDSTPVPTILGGPLTGLAPHTADFSSTVVGGNGTIGYLWDFGDGTILDQAIADPAEVTFNTPGSFSVVLRVTDQDGDIGEATTTVVVGTDDTPEVSVAAEPTSGVAPLTVNFTAAVAGGNGVSTLSWDLDGDDNFGDSIAANPSFTYEETGTFVVTVVATDEDGSTDIAQVSIVVSTDTTIFSVTADRTIVTAGNPLGVPALTANFTCTASDGDAPPDHQDELNLPLSYRWDFGDGATSTQQNPSHTYAAAGTFTAVCTVTDGDGDAESGTTAVVVNADTAPDAAITATPANSSLGLAGQSIVQFTSAVTGGNGTLLYAWDFGLPGDTDISTEASPQFPYTTPGTFTVMLEVTDENGEPGAESDTVTTTVVVRDYAEPTVVASAVPSTGVSPLTVQLFANTTGSEPLSFAWDFTNDGTVDSSEQNPTFVYASGTNTMITAEVVVSDAEGGTDDDTVTIDLRADELPVVTFNQPTLNPSRVPATATFTCSFTNSNAPSRLQWVFGDGQTATVNDATSSQGAVHTYGVPGSYATQCIVTDADGDTVSVSRTVIVEANSSPDVALSATPSSGIADLEVDFVASVAGGDGTIEWSWSFGPGATLNTAPANSETESVTYGAGTRIATVTACDEDGDCDSASRTIVVLADSVPTVDAAGTPNSGESPLTVQFSADVTEGNAPLTIEWDFADNGTTGIGANTSHTYTWTGPDEPQQFVAMVTVTDANGDVVTDTVPIFVDPPNRAPEAVALGTTCTGGLQLVELNGEASDDLDEDDVLSYLWQFTQLPAGSDAELDNPTLRSPTFVTDVDGFYVVQLEVSDGELIDRDEIVVWRTREPTAIVVFDDSVRTGEIGNPPEPPMDVQVQNECGAGIDGLELVWEGGGAIEPEPFITFTFGDGFSFFEGVFGDYIGEGTVEVSVLDDPDSPTETFDVFVEANCIDGIQNGNEVGRDCGDPEGSCGFCCGATCETDEDCAQPYTCGSDPDVCEIEGIWFVDQSQTTLPEDGECWETAFTTVQPGVDEALAAASPGAPQQVWVADGTYYPGHRDGIRIEGGGNIELYGGFQGDEVALFQRNPPAFPAVLDGDGPAGNPQPATWHVLNIFVDDDVLIDGFEVRDGDAGGGGFASLPEERHNSGGGLIVHGSNRITVRNVRFDSNTASRFGGGMNVSDSNDVLLEDVFFFLNEADDSGGGLAFGATGSGVVDGLTLDRVRFFDNQAGEFPSGMTSPRGGAGLLLTRFDDVAIFNSVFVGNYVHAGHRGGAIYADGVGSPTSNLDVTHASMAGNTGATSVESIFAQSNMTFVLANSIVADCGASDCVDAPTATFPGTDADPDGDVCDVTASDFVGYPTNLRLSLDSDCIDQGDNTYCLAGRAQFDFDRFFRPFPEGGFCDPGAYEAVDFEGEPGEDPPDEEPP